VEQAREMLIAAAREMIAAYRQLKASLRYSHVAQARAGCRRSTLLPG